MNIPLLKKIDHIIGMTLAKTLLPPPATTFLPQTPLSILFIRPGGIGDAVHLIPAVQAVRHMFPDAAIDVLAEQRNSAIFDLSPDIRTVSRYDVPGELFSLCRKKYDVVIDTEQWHYLSAVVARFISAPMKIGFATNERYRLFTHTVSYSHADYEVMSLLRLLEPLGNSCMEMPNEAFLNVMPDVDLRAQRLLGDIVEHRYVVIFPGASIQERRWNVERFAEVARQIVTADSFVVVVGSGADSSFGERICANSGCNLAGKTSLAETAAVISRATVLLSGDSGILHLAVGLGVPTVSLFGPGIAAKWAPRGAKHIVINHELPCSPCTKFGTTPRCPIGVKCMNDISVDEVTTAIFSLLNKK